MNLLVKLPILSDLTKDIDLTKFFQKFLFTFKCGNPITLALELTENVVTNPEVERGIRHAKEMVASGKKTFGRFKNDRKIFPAS